MLIGFLNSLCAQSKIELNPELETLSRLSKDSLIAMAIKQIDYSTFDPASFDTVEGWSSSEGVFIKFIRFIQVIPKKGRLCFSVTVDLINKSIGYSELGGSNVDDAILFYKPNHEDDAIINQIKKAMAQNGKNVLSGEIITIEDGDHFFNVHIDSESSSGRFRIDKSTSKISDESHRHKVPVTNLSLQRIF